MPAADERPAIVDPHDNAFIVTDLDERTERQGAVRRRHRPNAALAAEMPYFQIVERWFVAKIDRAWPGNPAAQRWSEARERVDDPELERDLARKALELWAADRAALAGKDKLAALSARLEKAKRKVVAEVATEPQPEPEPKIGGLPAVIEPTAFGEVALPVFAAEQDAIGSLNEKHAVIANYGGKCLVVAWDRWNVNELVLVPTFQSFETFKHRYCHKTVTVGHGRGTKQLPAGEFWLTHPDRRGYEGVVCKPGQPQVLPGNVYNLWRGFAVEPRRGNWKLLRSHISRVIAAGDPKGDQYIINWLAWAVRNPGKPAEAVLVLQGGEGAGKGTLARAMLKIFGVHGLPISDPALLIGDFSGHLQYCVFLFLDEAFWPGDRKLEGKLKSLITEPTCMIHPKFVTPFQVTNLLHMMWATNNKWAVPAGHDARRYAVFKVSNEKVGDFAYFDQLNAELDNGGVEAMLFDLLRMNLGGWKPKFIYQTQALLEQKQHSLHGLDAWIEAILQGGTLPNVYSTKYPNRCLSEHLSASAQTYDRYTNPSRVADKLKELFHVEHFNNQKSRGWIFPSLTVCRKLWADRNGGKWIWFRDLEDWG
jgi:hypothetical protein